MGKRLQQTFHQRRRTNGQQVSEKMLNVTGHQGNANQNHNEIPPNTCYDGNQRKKPKGQQVLVGMWRKWNPFTLQKGM